jgi:hypothetical protein
MILIIELLLIAIALVILVSTVFGQNAGIGIMSRWKR